MVSALNVFRANTTFWTNAMTDQLPLLRRDPVTLDGIIPTFTRDEVLFGVTSFQVQTNRGGFGVYHEDQPPPVYETRYRIKVCESTLEGIYEPYGNPNAISASDDIFTVVAKIINHFFSNKQNRMAHWAAWDYLTTNSAALNNSKRYWQAVEHLKTIKLEEEKLEEQKRLLERARALASLKAMEVRENRWITGDERRRIWAELTGESD